MKQGSIVAINYTGLTKLDGKVFESTVEKKAIEAGIFSEKQSYEPLVVVVGEGDVLKGLDNALLEMKEGEQRKIEVSPAEGWGERKPGNISVVPLQQFKKEKMNPFPGLVVELNGMRGRVQSVSGGRVRVDFNHPLAGKELVYDLRVERELTELKEQVEALYRKYFYMVPEAEKKLVVGKDCVEVTLSPRYSANIAPLKQAFSGMVTKHVKGFGKVRFIEEFKEEKTESPEKDGKTGSESQGKAEKIGPEKSAGKAGSESPVKKPVEKPGKTEAGKTAGKSP